MKYIEQTKQMRDSIEMQIQLYDFCIECIEKLYPEHKRYVISQFEDGIAGYDFNGCIQTLYCLDSNLEHHKKHMEEYKKKAQAKEEQ